MTKKQANYYLQRIYKYLASDESIAVIRRMKHSHGEFDWAKREIALDPMGSLLPAIIHECLHGMYGDQENHPGAVMNDNCGFCSTWVQKTEDGICKHMSRIQWLHLLERTVAKLLDCGYRGGG